MIWTGGSTVWKELWNGESGQDMLEYSLLLAFIALSGAAMYIGVGRSINGLWTIANSRLASAAGGGS